MQKRSTDYFSPDYWGVRYHLECCAQGVARLGLLLKDTPERGGGGGVNDKVQYRGAGWGPAGEPGRKGQGTY